MGYVDSGKRHKEKEEIVGTQNVVSISRKVGLSMNNNNKIWCAIPIYNNGTTVKKVALECRSYLEHVVVVDDGSTDIDVTNLFKETDVTVLVHEENQGKGAALKTALDYIDDKNAEYMITIDGDGQHFAEDIDKFLSAIAEDDSSLIVGCRDFTADNIPEKSKFGRSFSNLWLKIETGLSLDDTQTGFRAYPVKLIKQLKLNGSFYDFEVEVLARGAWAGLKLKQVDIGVYYPKPEDRVTSFDSIKDNFRISLMHTRLVGRRLNPWPHKKLIQSKTDFDKTLLKNPIKLFKYLLSENATPMGLAVSAAVGTIIAVLPIIGLHTVTIIYVTARLHLNKIMALAIQTLYSPPFVPFVCIEVGYFMRKGHWLTDFSLTSFKSNWHTLIYDWFLGSLVMAPFYAIVAAVAVYFISLKLQNNAKENNS